MDENNNKITSTAADSSEPEFAEHMPILETPSDKERVDEDSEGAVSTDDDVSLELFEKFATLQHLLMHRRLAGRGRKGGPVADPMRGQGRILALLKVKDGVSTKDMSNVLGIRTSSLNEILGKLERKGFVVREQSEEDKRVMVVKLTAEGRAVEQPSARRGAADMFDCLTDEEKAAFGSYLDRIIAELESKASARGECDREAMRREHKEAYRKFFGEDGDFEGRGFPPFGGFEATLRTRGFDSFGDTPCGGHGQRGGRGGCRPGGHVDSRCDAE